MKGRESRSTVTHVNRDIVPISQHSDLVGAADGIPVKGVMVADPISLAVLVETVLIKRYPVTWRITLTVVYQREGYCMRGGAGAGKRKN
jgi:hypothetical protein